ncbi:hypothetical protein GCM10009727_46520 [Actinomadura napierensis]|uniref:Uncharacterized protein n=1 Tax=Actinomadura napierensis TaxID=267854 RepID=A0ABN2ZQ15_9ACTN
MAAAKAELFERIRRVSWREGLSVQALARRYGVHRRVVREALTHAEPALRKTPRRAFEQTRQSLRCLAGTDVVYHRGPRRVPVIASAGRSGHSRHG